MIEQALHYAGAGLAVLPIKPRAKEPLVAHGVKDATTDDRQIRAWWRRWPDANLAIAVPLWFFVVDVDPRSDGDATLGELLATCGTLPATVNAVTGSGGAHFLYRRPPGVSLRGKLGPGIDVLSVGKYFLAAPSVHPCGGRYRWTVQRDPVVADAPAWLLDRVVIRSTPAAVHSYHRQTNGSNVERARRYLLKVPGAISGSGGHTCTFTTAQRLVHGFLLDEGTAYALMTEWNQRCEPPWSELDLRRKVHQAAIAGRMSPGLLADAKRRER